MYIVRYNRAPHCINSLWNDNAWNMSEAGEIIHFRHEGSDHRPKTIFRLSYSDNGISGIFFVEDRYVRCVHSGYMAPVYKDSCVEFFVRPYGSKGYFNFEFNCGGSMLCSYITDQTRTPEGFKEFVPLSEKDLQSVQIFHSLPGIITEEITDPVTWILEFFIPFEVLEKYAGKFGNLSGQIWTANFQKCGDSTSHPHWASWQPLPELNFHLPDSFGKITFESR